MHLFRTTVLLCVSVPRAARGGWLHALTVLWQVRALDFQQSHDFMKANRDNLLVCSVSLWSFHFFLSSGQQEEWDEERRRLQHGNRWRCRPEHTALYNTTADNRISFMKPGFLECLYARCGWKRFYHAQVSVWNICFNRLRCLWSSGTFEAVVSGSCPSVPSITIEIPLFNMHDELHTRASILSAGNTSIQWRSNI